MASDLVIDGGFELHSSPSLWKLEMTSASVKNWIRVRCASSHSKMPVHLERRDRVQLSHNNVLRVHVPSGCPHTENTSCSCRSCLQLVVAVDKARNKSSVVYSTDRRASAKL